MTLPLAGSRRRATGAPEGVGRRLAALCAAAVCAAVSAETLADRQALLDLYAATGGATWLSSCQAGWTSLTTSSDVCGGSPTVYGVRCTSGNIYAIDLYDCNLTGTLPGGITAISTLVNLDLHNNGITGTLPAQWSSLTSFLRIYLHSNRISGTLPPEWSAMTSLLDLYLHSNVISGTLPPEWSAMRNIVLLQLHANGISGSLPASWTVGMSKIATTRLCNASCSGLPPESTCTASGPQTCVGIPLWWNCMTPTVTGTAGGTPVWSWNDAPLYPQRATCDTAAPPTTTTTAAPTTTTTTTAAPTTTTAAPTTTTTTTAAPTTTATPGGSTASSGSLSLLSLSVALFAVMAQAAVHVAI